MTFLGDMRTVCQRLAPYGWADLLEQHGLTITAPNLAEELAKELPGICRRFPGFDDFPIEGQRGIEPGHPDRSLLLHALTFTLDCQIRRGGCKFRGTRLNA